MGLIHQHAIARRRKRRGAGRVEIADRLGNRSWLAHYPTGGHIELHGEQRALADEHEISGIHILNIRDRSKRFGRRLSDLGDPHRPDAAGLPRKVEKSLSIGQKPGPRHPDLAARAVLPALQHRGAAAGRNAEDATRNSSEENLSVAPRGRHAHVRHIAHRDRRAVRRIEPLQLVGHEEGDRFAIRRPDDGARAFRACDRTRVDRRQRAHPDAARAAGVGGDVRQLRPVGRERDAHGLDGIAEGPAGRRRDGESNKR